MDNALLTLIVGDGIGGYLGHPHSQADLRRQHRTAIRDDLIAVELGLHTARFRAPKRMAIQHRFVTANVPPKMAVTP